MSTAAASFGIAIPQQPGADGFDAPGLRAYLQEAEHRGFTSAWVGEQVLGTAPILSPLEVLSFAACCTTRLRLGTSALISTVHSPLHLAHAIATVDHLSGGRVEVGVAGGGTRRPFAAFGMSAEGYATRFAEGIALMTAAWQQPEVTLTGRFYQAQRLPIEPKPVQRPRPPLWIGGGHPAAVRRAVRLADGFFGAGSTTTAAFAAQVDIARAALRDAGRDPAGFRIAKRIYLAVDDDPERARRRVRGALAERYDWYGLPDMSPVAVAGTPDECADGVRAVLDAGAQLVLLDPMDADLAHLDRITDVIERVHR
jgi:probable F420-dependent oxidoreductase